MMPSLAVVLVGRGFADEEFGKIFGEIAACAFDAVRKKPGAETFGGRLMDFPSVGFGI